MISGYNYSPLYKYNIAPNYEVRRIGDIKFLQDLSDLPAPVGGVIELDGDIAYYITNHLDLAGNRLEFKGIASLIGTSSETSFITSTGLGGGVPLITSTFTLSMQEITIQNVDTAVLINGTGTVALDWIGVNFLNVPNVGVINNASNFIYIRGAFLSSKGMLFKGTTGTIGFTDSLLLGDGAAGSIVEVDAGMTITARFRLNTCSVVAFGSTTGIDVALGATIPVESFILDTINFSGGGTYLPNLNFNDNKSLFKESKGITNTARICNYYMSANVTATTVLATGTPYKIAGTTSFNSAITQKFTHSNNRATYVGAITNFFEVSVNASIVSGNNNIIGLYIAINGTVIPDSEMYATTNAGGRAEAIGIHAVVELHENDYIEVFVENETSITDITAEYLNVIVKSLG